MTSVPVGAVVYDAISEYVYALQHDGSLASEQRFRDLAQGYFIVNAKEVAAHHFEDVRVLLNIYWPKIDQGRDNDIGWGLDTAWYSLRLYAGDWLVWGDDAVTFPPREVRDHVFSHHYKEKQESE